MSEEQSKHSESVSNEEEEKKEEVEENKENDRQEEPEDESANMTEEEWVFQNLKKQFEEDLSLRENWWYPLCNAVKSSEFEALRKWFAKVDTDRSGTLEIDELKMANWPGRVKLDSDTCHHLIKIFDVEMGESVGFYEYLAMIKFVELAVLQVEGDYIEHANIKSALSNLGFDLNDDSINIICKLATKKVKDKYKKAQFISIVSILGLIRSVYQNSIIHGISENFQKDEFSNFVNATLLVIHDL